MSLNPCRISLRKDRFKFSSAHMTVFADGTKESMHGHNYTVGAIIELKDTSLRSFAPFSLFKTILTELCQNWDEKLLLAQDCPFFSVTCNPSPSSEFGDEIEFQLCKKRYVLPRDEVLLLPLENITVESLSQELCRRFLEKLTVQKASLLSTEIQITVEESPGQGATSTWRPSES